MEKTLCICCRKDIHSCKMRPRKNRLGTISSDMFHEIPSNHPLMLAQKVATCRELEPLSMSRGDRYSTRKKATRVLSTGNRVTRSVATVSFGRSMFASDGHVKQKKNVAFDCGTGPIGFRHSLMGTLLEKSSRSKKSKVYRKR